MKRRNNILIFILISVVTTAALFFIDNFKLNKLAELNDETDKRIWLSLHNTPILAKATSVYNITDNKKIYGENDTIALPIASLAKIMTVVIGLEGRDMDRIIKMSQSAVDQEGNFEISVNEKWRVDDLAKFTLFVSANDGAYALAEGDKNFLEKMNTKAQKIGARSTQFFNVTGLDLDTKNATRKVAIQACFSKEALVGAGTIGSAEDVNLMATYALRAYQDIFSVTTLPELRLKSESGFIYKSRNTNLFVDRIPNLLFSKTGLTKIAGGNLTVIFKDKNGDEIAVTILGSTFLGRFTDVEKIVDVLYSL